MNTSTDIYARAQAVDVLADAVDTLYHVTHTQHASAHGSEEEWQAHIEKEVVNTCVALFAVASHCGIDLEKSVNQRNHRFFRFAGDAL